MIESSRLPRRFILTWSSPLRLPGVADQSLTFTCVGMYRRDHRESNSHVNHCERSSSFASAGRSGHMPCFGGISTARHWEAIIVDGEIGRVDVSYAFLTEHNHNISIACEVLKTSLAGLGIIKPVMKMTDMTQSSTGFSFSTHLTDGIGQDFDVSN